MVYSAGEKYPLDLGMRPGKHKAAEMCGDRIPALDRLFQRLPNDLRGAADWDQGDRFVPDGFIPPLSLLWGGLCDPSLVLFSVSESGMESDENSVLSLAYGCGDRTGMLCESGFAEVADRDVLIHWGRGIFKNPPAPMDQLTFWNFSFGCRQIGQV